MPKKLGLGKASALVELKAELYRKKEASKSASKAATTGLPLFVPSEQPFISKEEAESRAAAKEAQGRKVKALHAAVLEEEKRERLAKAQLERKARLYDAMKSGQTPQGQHSLVNFDLARAAREREEEEEEEEEGWLEFTDSFGRQRRCRRNDLKDWIAKDEKAKAETELGEVVGTSAETAESEEGGGHYQSLLGSEAREHGVSYFAFSKDEEERSLEMERLNALRASTNSARLKAQELKRKREAAVAQRLEKVRQRKKLKGPEETLPEGNEPVEEEEKEEDLGEALQRELKKAEERVRENQRERHVRDWDRGKVQLSQESYIDQQRQMRPSQFAPPRSY